MSKWCLSLKPLTVLVVHPIHVFVMWIDVTDGGRPYHRWRPSLSCPCGYVEVECLHSVSVLLCVLSGEATPEHLIVSFWHS